MARIDATELKKVTLKVVQNASRPGAAMDKGEFTLGIARKEISIRMGLGPRGLEEAEWKARVKELVHLAMDEVAEEVSAQASSPVKPQYKSSSPGKASKGNGPTGAGSSGSAKGSRKDEMSDAESAEVEEEEEEVEDSSPRSRPTEKRHLGKKVRSRPKRKSSSEGDGTSTAASQDSRPTTKGAAPKRKTGGAQKPKKVSPIEISDSEEGQREREDRASRDDVSESEMSSLYDVAPAPKRSKGTSKARGSSEDATRKRKDPNEGVGVVVRGHGQHSHQLSTEEAHVADLRKIVTACGVRKIWSKEFADDPTPKEQRHRIEVMLRELGMKGKPTLGKARALKEKRELAAELNDVQEFEAARGLSSSRASRSKAKSAAQRDPDSDSDADEQASDEPQGAFGAIMDFLGDDAGSDSD